jgi:3'-5' exonuclease
MTDEQLYFEKAGLQAEFGKIVCVSFGKVKFQDDPDLPPVIQIVSYAGEDEKAILTQVFKVFNAMAKNKIMPFGHNCKRFDIPYLCKRAFINGIEPALPLQVWDKKPWEIEVKDSSELWSFGAWQEGFTSLELLCTVLGLPTPKDEMKGDQVHGQFWSGNIEGIKAYCQKDVLALIRVAFALSQIHQFEESDIIYKS